MTNQKMKEGCCDFEMMKRSCS